MDDTLYSHEIEDTGTGRVGRNKRSIAIRRQYYEALEKICLVDCRDPSSQVEWLIKMEAIRRVRLKRLLVTEAEEWRRLIASEKAKVMIMDDTEDGGPDGRND